MAEFRLIGGNLILPSSSVTNESIADDAEIDGDKLQHFYHAGTNFDLPIASTPVAREEIVWVATTAAIVRVFSALLNDTGTTTNVSFDLKKNGTTMLSALPNVTNADADKVVKDGTLSVTAIAVDDVISMQLTVTTSTGAQGPYCFMIVEESSA